MFNIAAKAIHHTKDHGDFDVYVVKDDTQCEHVVLIRGEVRGGDNVLCRVSSECLPGTTLESAECDCQEQIRFSLNMINKEDRGIFIYLLGQEGRGHGLTTKVKALKLKNDGHDTFSAVEELGLQADIRNYSTARNILSLFQVRSIILLSNNPEKVAGIRNEGVVVSDTRSISVSATGHSARHLVAKRDRGHTIDVVKAMSDSFNKEE